MMRIRKAQATLWPCYRIWTLLRRNRFPDSLINDCRIKAITLRGARGIVLLIFHEAE